MICSWKALLQILPPKIKADADTLGKNDLNELRLRLDAPVEMVLGTASHYTEYSVTQEDIDYIVNCASRYSPWAAASIAKGYLTAMGGHRIGVCGFGVFRGFLRKDLIHSFIGSEKMTDGWQTKSTPSGAFCLIQGELDFNCRMNLFHRFIFKITTKFALFQSVFWQQS